MAAGLSASAFPVLGAQPNAQWTNWVRLTQLRMNSTYANIKEAAAMMDDIEERVYNNEKIMKNWFYKVLDYKEARNKEECKICCWGL